MTSLADRIDRRTDRSGGPDSCWEWRGSRARGRAQVYLSSRPGRSPQREYVARIVLAWKLGRPLLPGRFACHTCDNPGCVNPGHLYEGTPKSNSDDMWARGREGHTLGSKRPDVTARHIREAAAQGHFYVDVIDWSFFADDPDESVRQFIARRERGDIPLEAHPIDDLTVTLRADVRDEIGYLLGAA